MRPSITVQEIFDYGTYDDAEFTGVSMGFGFTPDQTPIMFLPGVLTIPLGRTGEEASPTASASSSTMFVNATKPG